MQLIQATIVHIATACDKKKSNTATTTIVTMTANGNIEASRRFMLLVPIEPFDELVILRRMRL